MEDLKVGDMLYVQDTHFGTSRLYSHKLAIGIPQKIKILERKNDVDLHLIALFVFPLALFVTIPMHIIKNEVKKGGK